MGTSPSVAVSSLSFSFRPPAPLRPAVELLDEIRARGGRVYRMRQAPSVFVLTTDPALAHWLLDMGARVAKGGDDGYVVARDSPVREWDTWIHRIPVSDDETIWEAAGHVSR